MPRRKKRVHKLNSNLPIDLDEDQSLYEVQVQLVKQKQQLDPYQFYLVGDVYFDCNNGFSLYSTCGYQKFRKIVRATNNFTKKLLTLDMIDLLAPKTSLEKSDLPCDEKYEELYKQLECHLGRMNQLTQQKQKQFKCDTLLPVLYYNEYKQSTDKSINEFLQSNSSKPIFYHRSNYNPITALNYNFIQLVGLNEVTVHQYFLSQGFFYWFDLENRIKFTTALLKYQNSDSQEEDKKDTLVFHTLDNIEVKVEFQFHHVKGECLSDGYSEDVIFTLFHIDPSQIERLQFIRSMMNKRE